MTFHLALRCFASLLVASVVASLLAAEGQRPFIFKQCPQVSVRVGDLSDPLKPYKNDFKAVVEKRLRGAGVLAPRPNNLTLRLRIIDLGQGAYLVDLDLFHRMDEHEYGRGLVILWGILGIEQYRGESAPIRGLAEIADELTATFIRDYRADGCL